MKVQVVLCAIISCFTNTFAFWDAGHMLIGEIATQYMDPNDVHVLQKLLSKWDDEFPNTGEITTATQWADIVKCNKPASYCPSPLFPSIKVLDKLHYSGLTLKMASTTQSNVTTSDLFEAAEGDAHTLMEDTVSTFQSTKSIWSANFMLRFLLHVFGDIHQPLHTTNGVSEQFPTGDQGGNRIRFQTPCAYRNLHALWDATAGVYSYSWNMTMDNTRVAITQDAQNIRQRVPIHDTLNYASTRDMSYEAFADWIKEAQPIRETIMESYRLSESKVYGPLSLCLNEENRVACPSEEYVRQSGQVLAQQIHLGGYRLSFLLSQLAKQVIKLKLVENSFC